MEPGIALFDEDEAAKYLTKHIKSREWWVIFQPNDHVLASRVEEKFYSGKKNEHFILLTGMAPWGSGILGIFLARKKEMSPKQLAALMNKLDPRNRVKASDLKDHDLIFPYYGDDSTLKLARVKETSQWVQSLYAEHS